jgi:hypothetical protein
VPNDQVVKELNVEQPGGGEQLTREPQVLIGGLRVATRMVVDGGESDSVRLENGAQQFTDAHTRTRRGPRVDVAQIEQTITAVDDGDVELLLGRPAKDWLSDRGEVGRCLHPRSFGGPPRGEITCCGQGLDDDLRRVRWHSGTLQPVGDVPSQ